MVSLQLYSSLDNEPTCQIEFACINQLGCGFTALIHYECNNCTISIINHTLPVQLGGTDSLIHYECNNCTISTLITCNQFIAMVQVGYITLFGLYGIYTASGGGGGGGPFGPWCVNPVYTYTS